MNNKIEIFKLALQAGSIKLNEEQSKFAIDCFIKAEKLSGGASSHHQKPNSKSNGPKTGLTTGPNTWTGRGLFIKKKMSELKSNGADYNKNKSTAVEAWTQLKDEEKEDWNKKASSMAQK